MTAEPFVHTTAAMDNQGETLLEVRNLKKYFPVHSSGVIRRVVGHVQAVDGVSFAVQRGGSLGLVGGAGGVGRGGAWAGRAAGSRPRAGSPPACTSRPRGRCCSRARTWPPSPSARCCRCARRSR